MVEYRKSEGCATVEMECAALAACAQKRGAVFGQILYTADSLRMFLLMMREIAEGSKSINRAAGR